MSKEIKKMIIENFIDHNFRDEEVRKIIKSGVDTYVEEDHVDEIAQAGFHKVDENINLYAEDYRDDTWEEMCKVCGVSSEAMEMMIPFAKALVKPNPFKKKFRITYRMEVFVDADSEEEATSKFEDLELSEQNTEFVEVVSVEKSE
jgi:hypothetical protein